MNDRKWGRLIVPDGRDAAYQMMKVGVFPAQSRIWHTYGWLGDQGSLGACVGFSWAHWLHASPFRQFLHPVGIYQFAQTVDDWPGEDYEGSTVRAGAKVLHRLGLIREYRWATSAQQVAKHIVDHSPVVVGTAWYTGMMIPDGDGFVLPQGELLGGHAYLLCGWSATRRAFRIKNSWGEDWGQRGYAWIRGIDFDALLDGYGEACVGIEKFPETS